MASVLVEIRRRARWVIPQLVGLALCAYFAFHLVQGDRGVRNYLRLTEELTEAQVVEAALMADLARERQRVAALSNASLDPDLLEERARVLLNMGRPGEYVIFVGARASQ